MATKKTVAKKSDPKLVKDVKRRVAVAVRAAVTAQIKEMAERPSDAGFKREEKPKAQPTILGTAATATVAGAIMLSAAVVKDAKLLQRQKKELEAELEELSAHLKAKEQAIIAALDAGAQPEPGCPAVAVERTERITPKWKDEAILLVKDAGRNVEVYEAEVRARTKPVVIVKLVINGDVKKG